MSYTLQLWEKPADWPWPTTKAEAEAQFERAADGPRGPLNPKFVAWANAVEGRLPEAMDIWRAVVALLAGVPMLGMAVSLGLLFKAVRER